MITFGIAPGSPFSKDTIVAPQRDTTGTVTSNGSVSFGSKISDLFKIKPKGKCVTRVVGTTRVTDCRCSAVIVANVGGKRTIKWVCPPLSPSLPKFSMPGRKPLVTPSTGAPGEEVIEENITVVADETKVPPDGSTVTDTGSSSEVDITVGPPVLPDLSSSFFQRHKTKIIYGFAALGSLFVASKLLK